MAGSVSILRRTWLPVLRASYGVAASQRRQSAHLLQRRFEERRTFSAVAEKTVFEGANTANGRLPYAVDCHSHLMAFQFLLLLVLHQMIL
jgi:hypothetical protein